MSRTKSDKYLDNVSGWTHQVQAVYKFCCTKGERTIYSQRWYETKAEADREMHKFANLNKFTKI